MTLDEFSNYLFNNKLCSIVLGIDQDNFALLQDQFSKTDAKDKTKSTNKASRLLILLLIRQFDLTDENIRRIFLPNVTTAVFNKFKTVVMPRLDTALNNSKINLDHSLAPLLKSTLVPQHYQTPENFFNAIILAVSQGKTIPLIATSKSQEITPTWLTSYATKPVTSKRKTGQQAFIESTTSLVYDIEQFSQLPSYYIIPLASTLNLYTHHASFIPMRGYGKAQKREIESPLLYSRSQSQHPHGIFYKRLTSKTQNVQCLLPRNVPLDKIFSYEVKSNFVTNLNMYGIDGYLNKKFNQSSYFGLQFAYSGLRTNAYKFTCQGLSGYLSDHNVEQLVSLIDNELQLKSEKNILKLPRPILQSKNEYILSLANTLKKKLDAQPYQSNIYLNLTKFRRHNAQSICELTNKNKLKNININYDAATNCLDISFYPEKSIPTNANYSEGITNVIISFFTGLLNYNLHMAGLSIKAHRRQSFAFNRITITDTTNMCMRVSLGYEPSSFIPVFVKSLEMLDNLLHEFNFLDRKDKKLSAGFKVVEKSRGENETESTGIQFLNFARSSSNILSAVNKAKSCLIQEISPSDAFQKYIDYISTPVFVEEDNDLNINPDKIQDNLSDKNNILVAGLLHNLLKYTLEKINLSSTSINNDKFLYSYSHTLSKLIKLCYKADYWLQNHEKFYSSHVYAKVLLLIEDIIERLSILDGLCITSQQDVVSPDTYLDKLTQTEKYYTASALNVPHNAINVFYTDNGQQALTASILCMAMQIFNPEDFRSLSNHIYAFGKCYFELFNNLKSNLELTESKKFESAQFVLVDIRQLTEFKASYTVEAKAKIIVIDCTHNPCLDDGELRNIVNQLLNDKRWVIITESMLKHEQLGLDKFQAGKIITLSPVGSALKAAVRDELSSITKAAMHPAIASYFTMINEICRDKMNLTASTTDIGLFKTATINAVSVATKASKLN